MTRDLDTPLSIALGVVEPAVDPHFIHVRPHSMGETRFFMCCWKTI